MEAIKKDDLFEDELCGIVKFTDATVKPTQPVKAEKKTASKEPAKEEPQHTDEPVFFKGITDLDTLKSRYRKLMKAYHTDEATGDTETAELINEEYEYMKKLLTDKQKQERPA